MEQSRIRFFLILLIIILTTPNGLSPGSPDEPDVIVLQEKERLAILRNSTYGFPGNLTGINFTHGAVPPAPVRELARSIKKEALGEQYLDRELIDREQPLRPASTDAGGNVQGGGGKGDSKAKPPAGGKVGLERLGTHDGRSKWENEFMFDHQFSLYRNASGTLHGTWERLKMPGLEMPVTNLTYVGNVTADKGKIIFAIEEKREPGEVQEVTVTMIIKNEEGGDVKEISLSGVHFTNTGEMFLTTTSDRFAGIFALPHFTLTESAYNKSKTLLLESLSTAIQHQEDGTPWPYSSEVDGGSPHCEYIVYFQLHPVGPPDPPSPFITFNPETLYQPSVSPETLEQIEKELRHPTGAPVPDAPPIIASSIIYSPTCGYVLGIKRAQGVKIERYYHRAANFALGTAAATCVQMWLLFRQMKDSSTPSTISRISFWTMAMMTIVDSYISLVFLAVATFIDPCFLVFTAAAFLLFLLVSVFGMRYMKIIYDIQRPTRRSAQPIPPVAPPAVVTPLPPSLPEPVTAPRTSQSPQPAPAIIPLTQNTNTTGDGRQDTAMLYSRFSFVLLGLVFVTMHAATWPPFLRNLFMNTAVILANGFWVPQIYRNVMRGCRKAFSWEFVVGTSICRLLGVIYAYCWRGNLFEIEPDWRVAMVMLLPPAYDYHPILPLGDLEAGDSHLPPPSTPTGETALPPNSRLFDCAICMQSVEVPTLPRDREASGGSSIGFLGRLTYMVTPCRHVFHSNCLEGWMKFRLQCPICRDSLPPL